MQPLLLYRLPQVRSFASFLTLVLLGSEPALQAADRFWDGGNASITANGDGLASSFTSGTWNTSLTNWDQGAGLPHTSWNNANLDSAVFGGPYSATNVIRTIDLTADIVLNQLRITTGSTGGNRYDIGSTATEPNSITFGGTYSDASPALVASNALNVSGHNTNFNAKITGTIAGGLVVDYQSNITTPGSSGRLNFTNVANDFTGDVTLLAGNLSAGAVLGVPANKLILKGGALFVSGGAAVTTTFSRNIEVSAASGIGTNAAGSGVQALQLTGTLSGSGNLIRYASIAGSAISEVRLQGDLSGYTGTFDNRGGLLIAQTTATSGGAWKLTGGTLKLDATNDNVIANGPGLSDLLMAGGILNLNSHPEVINGLSGATGTVQCETGAATLVVGDGDATASFGGVLRDNGGVLSLTKTGAGTQTLTGTSTFTGVTTVKQGSLIVDGSIASVADVNGTGVLGGSGTMAGAAVTESGKISPATSTSIGTLLSTGEVLFAAGTQYEVQINSNGTPTCDRLTVMGALDLGGTTLSIGNLGSVVLPSGTRLVLATASGPITRTFAGIANAATVTVGGNIFTIKYNDTEGLDNAVTLTAANPVGGYASWALANGVGAASADDDKDGTDNALEYVLGTNPTAPNPENLAISIVGPDLFFTFNRSDLSETPDVAIVIEVSTDLINWNANSSPYIVGATTATSTTGVTVNENPAAPGVDPGTDLITLKLPLGSDVRKSVRIKVTVTP